MEECPNEMLMWFIKARRENAENGLEVENVKMEPLQMLVVPFWRIWKEHRDEFKESVEEIVNWDKCGDPEPQVWEVQIGELVFSG